MTRSSFVSSTATPVRLACRLAVVSLLGSLAACSTLDNTFSSEKVDYRSGARQTTGLDIPPDLKQLARDNRNQPQGESVSAATFQQKGKEQKVAAAGMPSNLVALNAVADMRIERSGAQRWLISSLTPEQLWPQVREFWQERGFEVLKDSAEVGVMETNWNENRAKLPQDIIRSTIGKVFDGFYSTGEKDMFRTRLERGPNGTEVFISHKGMQEVYTGAQKDNTAWQPRPNDPELEAEMLSRLMLKLGAKDEQAKAALAAAKSAGPTVAGGTSSPAAAATAGATKTAVSRSLADVPDTLQVNEGFERAWRRVGQSLDRHGFTIEDRDRKQGLFFLRYADPSQAGKEEPNFFQKLFSSDSAQVATRYRVSVKSEGERSVVTVLDDKGQQQTNENAKRILNLLMDDLR
ncbi:outer membrane protein assembly factor BamC [Roseateles oligotrophus]|uniref:Outer membrane protein assembly factor BamC n=1 Tax=Roseateles oligotrophus TaxID=1769250 RepID=A0ABT2YLN7_9BURK|nr:outer membrane protein assembly factor BamC [Roseateles oligotrophus]MCV2370963.1 outer membrane protein assembly factor BamC [Roseateles oligotrophus]